MATGPSPQFDFVGFHLQTSGTPQAGTFHPAGFQTHGFEEFPIMPFAIVDGVTMLIGAHLPSQLMPAVRSEKLFTWPNMANQPRGPNSL